MTRFPLFSVPPDKFALICLLGTVVLGVAMFMSGAPPKPEQSAAEPASDVQAAVALPEPGANGVGAKPAAASAPTLAAAPAPAEAPRYSVKTVAGQPTFVEAASLAGLSASVAYRVAQALGNRVDFRRDWRASNRVSFVFDRKERARGDTAHRPIMPAAVRVRTHEGEHDIFLYRNLKGHAFYYTKNGDRARGGGFLRYPIRFRRVSSPFSLHRFDPVLKRWQPHDGVDLAAPAGTPVHATGNGVVTFAGVQTGYGNVIEIRNRAPYSTVFAHLLRFAKGIRAGTRVRRDQVIGYVGATGWATGPHLHYEVHVGDEPKNPLTVSLPPAEPLHGRELSRFASRSETLEGLL